MAADGTTYSRAAIVGWLRGHDLSPMTIARLKGKDLYPHIEKRVAVKAWLKTRKTPSSNES